MLTKEQALLILKEVYNTCNDLYGGKISDAYLYGSYARGDFHENSDVDILLAVDMQSSELSQYRRKLASITSSLSSDYDVTVSVTVKPTEQFHRYLDALPYYANVVREGIRYGEI